MKSNQLQTPLYDALSHYAKTQPVAFDVPGHKLGQGIHSKFKDDVGSRIFEFDVNSMRELDSLSNPTGVIKEAEALAAELFHADHAFFLVNGSTSGVQKMILSVCGDNDKIVLPRNVHKSAINALILSGAQPIYLDPVIDLDSGLSMGVSYYDVVTTLEQHPDTKAILLLNPNYFGFTSDLKRIIAYAHQKNIAVLIDESHGSHFSLDQRFPQSGIALGADMATISMHKTGGSLTQSSILLHNNGCVPYSKVRTTINVFQTSSASYLLLASLDMARFNLASDTKNKMTDLLALAHHANESIQAIPGFKIVDDSITDGDGIFAHDPSKLVIDVSAFGWSGYKFYDYFKEHYNIQFELGGAKIVLAIISIGDTKNSIDALITALKDFAAHHSPDFQALIPPIFFEKPTMIYRPREAFFKESMLIEIDKAEGMIAADSIMVYPPGIPLVVPGELISRKIIDNYIYLSDENNILIGSHKVKSTLYVKVLKP